jgi:uncharacterized protein (TIGR03435 family)
MRFWLAALAVCAAFGQTAGTPLSFEVASVKPASVPIATKDAYTEGYNAGRRAALSAQGLRVVGRRVTVTDNTLKDLIRIAYQVKEHQISGPSWIAVKKYEIAALMPAGADRAQAPEMLRTLLEQRFHLELHREMRKMPAYALVTVRGGAKLSAVAGPEGRNAMAGPNTGRVHMKSASLATFADLLSKAADRPVIDATGLGGVYDIDLAYLPELNVAAAESGPALAQALQEQLGLKLERRDIQVEVLVVDRADQVPVEN